MFKFAIDPASANNISVECIDNMACVIIGNPTERVVVTNGLKGVETQEVKIDLSGNVGRYVNSDSFDNRAFLVIARSGSELMSLREHRAAIEATYDDPEELNKAANEYRLYTLDGDLSQSEDPDPINDAINFAIAYAHTLGYIEEVYGCAPPGKRNGELLGYRLSTTGRLVKEVLFGLASIAFVQ